MLTFLCILAVLAVHRIWHYEDIAEPARNRLPMDPAITPLLIAPVIVAWSLMDHPAVVPGLAALACYPLLRGAVWVYKRFDQQAKPEGCTPCQEAVRMAKELQAWPKRVIVFGPLDLIKKLAKRHRKFLFICTDAHEPQRTEKNIRYQPFPPGATIQMLPFMIMQGGNATVVTVGRAHTPEWQALISRFGAMLGVAWAHVVEEHLDVPSHHCSVHPLAPPAALDTVITTAQPPRHP